MSAMADRLRDFTIRLFERRDVLVDWPSSADGLAILPAQVARVLHTPETLRLTTESVSAVDVLSAQSGLRFHGAGRATASRRAQRGVFAAGRSIS